jgi:LPS O-antigen subunit length determinant protein (WzzB/FepE family)
MQQDTAPQPQQYANDEIDLFELFENIWNQKWLIVVVTTVAVVLGGAFAFLSTPTYQASAQLQAPLESTLQELKALQNFKNLDAQQLLQAYIKALDSNEVKANFLKQMPENLKNDLDTGMSLQEQLKALEQHLSITVPKKDDQSIYSFATPQIILTTPSSASAISGLNFYLSNASDYQLDKMKNEHARSKQNKVRRIDERIELLTATEAMKREARIAQLEEKHLLEVKQVQDKLKARKYQYNQILNDRILRLQEALKIASRLGIKRPSTLAQQGQRNGARVEINADLRSNQDPLYLRGTEFLTAELEQLQTRPETFIDDGRVRELEAKLVELETNREIELLKARVSDAEFSQEIQILKSQREEIADEEFPWTCSSPLPMA